jgi:hypothetical protein
MARRRRIVIGEDVEKWIEEILSEIEKKPKMKDSCRISIANPGKCRQI